MANSNENNQNTSSKGRSYQRPSSPPKPTYTMVVTAGDPKFIKEGNVFKVLIEARVFKNDVAVKDEPVILKRGVYQIQKINTDATGTCLFTFSAPLGDHGQLIPLYLHLANRRVESSVTIALPKLSHLTDEDPERIKIRYYTVNEDGTVYISLRLMQNKGFSIPALGVVNYKGIDYECPINDEGYFFCLLPGNLEYGQAETVIAWVSGIVGEVKVNVYRPRQVLTPRRIFSYFVLRISFLVLFFGSVASFILVILSLIMIFSKSFKERLASNDGAGDIAWVIILMFCSIAPFFLIINTGWFFFRLKMSRAFECIKEKTVYHKNATARDSSWEKLAEVIEKVLNNHAQVDIKNQTLTGITKSGKSVWENIKIIVLSLLADIGFGSIVQQFTKH